MMRAVSVLWWRDIVRFLRQPSRLAGAFMQPIILWLVIAGGLRSTFAFPGMSELDYLEYFFPGVLVMMALFTAIFSTMSLIEDRHAGFMQAALVGPGTRSAVALGKMLAGATLALGQSLLFLILLPLAGFTLGAVDWLALIGCLALCGLAMTAAGVALAWWVDSTAGYHGLMSVLLMPAWFASGAMFPLPTDGAVSVILRLNPMSYMVDGVRRALYGSELPMALNAHLTNPAREWLVILVFTMIVGWLSINLCRRRDA
jgi:ABC-2 type transport system permease protein